MKKRVKSILINVIVVICMLCFLYYFSGYYISKDKCFTDMIKGRDSNDTDIIYEYKEDNEIIIISRDHRCDTWSKLAMYQHGFLYTPSSSVYEINIDKDKAFDIFVNYDNYSNGIITIYRNNKNIDSIKITFNDSRVVESKTWNGNFMILRYDVLNIGTNNIGVYEAFDSNGTLIEQRTY